jgi:DNA-binding CsgD family transcriptional regulator
MNVRNLAAPGSTDVGFGVATTAAALFGIIALLIGIDVAADYRAGSDTGHLLTEGLVMSLSLAGAAALWRQLGAARRRAQALSVDLAAARREADRFRDEARDVLRGLGEAIDRQFARWELTAAEREVGLLLLKGLSHKEIAAARSTTETTVRQQALAVYRKSDLRNRSDLSAFFLEDLLLPAGERGPS